MNEPKTATGRRIAELVAKAEDEAIDAAVEESARGYDRRLDQIARVAKTAIERGERDGASLWRDGLSRIVALAESDR